MSNQINNLQSVIIKTQTLINEQKSVKDEIDEIKSEVQKILTLEYEAYKNKIIESLLYKIEVYPNEKNVIKLDVLFGESSRVSQTDPVIFKDKGITYLAQAK
jgi:hypothetical protein